MTLLETATDWSAIWSITLVSFGLVLLILLLLVYVMKLFGLFFTKKHTESKAQETVKADDAGTASDEAEVVAAIGTAIALAQGALHIEEAGFLTFADTNRQTAWNNKAYGLRQMPERIK